MWLFLSYYSDTALIKTKKVLNIETQLLLILDFETKAHVEKGKMTQWDHPIGKHVTDFLIKSYHCWASPNEDSEF